MYRNLRNVLSTYSIPRETVFRHCSISTSKDLRYFNKRIDGIKKFSKKDMEQIYNYLKKRDCYKGTKEQLFEYSINLISFIKYIKKKEKKVYIYKARYEHLKYKADLYDELTSYEPVCVLKDEHENGNVIYKIASCPICKHHLAESNKDLLYGLPYCPYCGQKLDWPGIR